MKVEAVELRRLQMMRVTPFRSAIGREQVRDALIVRVLGADGEGWGECVAMRQPHYSPEYVEGAHHVIAHHLAPLLLRAPDVTGGGVAGVLAPVKGHPMAKAALELAVLDAELRATGRSLATELGARASSVAVGVAVGITGSVDDLLAEVGARVAEGYGRVKLKIEPGWDIEPVRAVRDRFGPELLLQVDANGSYALPSAAGDGGATLAALDPFDLLFIEQPLADDDLAGHAELAQRIRTRVCLDESITSARAAAEALERGACSVINLKPGRVGGYLEARRVHDVCVAHGAGLWVGGMFETGIGRAANLALAALPGCTFPGDISASDRYYVRDVTRPFVLRDGCLDVPAGPGIGVEVDLAAVEELTVRREVISGSRSG